MTSRSMVFLRGLCTRVCRFAIPTAPHIGLLGAALFIAQPTAAQVVGGTAASPVDITAQVLSNSNIQLGGGSFIVTVPVAGSAGTTPANAVTGLSAKLVDYGSGHYVGATAPTINYTGVISGTGVLTVSNATNATSNPGNDPTAKPTFDGGVLLFTQPQTFTNPGAVSLIISPNTTVAFDQGGRLDSSGSLSPQVTNNGYLYSWAVGNQTSWCNIAPTLSGAGVATFENGNILENGCSFSGFVYDMNGTHLRQQGKFPDPATKIAQTNIFVFETQGPNYLTNQAGIAFQSIYEGNYYSFGVDTQITGKGIQVFTGLELSSNGSTKKDFLPPEQSRLFDHFNEFGGRGAVFYIQATMQMGNGQAVINYTDTNNGNTYLTNNTFLQTNVSASHIEIGGFEHTPTSQAEALNNQAIGFDYSGTYTYDSGVNTNLSAPTQGVFSSPGLNYGNFIVMNPDPQNTGKAPNHLILTCPMFIHGVTQVDQNAILQLGDGTTGNSQARTLVIGTHSYAGTYSTSYGNGILLTAVNDTTTTLNTAFDEIIDNGAIIVDNTPGAADLQGDAAVSPALNSNELDRINGIGSLEQKGTMPLTLAGTNTYSGGTTVDSGATLLVATATALGTTGSSGQASAGALVNHGVLETTGSNHVITVPGAFTQS